MGVLPLISLLITVIKIAIQVSEYLKDHPDLLPNVQQAISNLNADLNVMHRDLREEAHRIPEAP